MIVECDFQKLKSFQIHKDVTSVRLFPLVEYILHGTIPKIARLLCFWQNPSAEICSLLHRQTLHGRMVAVLQTSVGRIHCSRHGGCNRMQTHSLELPHPLTPRTYCSNNDFLTSTLSASVEEPSSLRDRVHTLLKDRPRHVKCEQLGQES
jgi:hypothetical protein